MLTCRRMLLTIIALGFLTAGSAGRANDPASTSYYLIGNSLTWDTIPGLLDGDVQWHVDCGKPLTYIYANPGEPCVKTSTLWPTALKEKQYDFVSVQPHYGSTLQQDADTISAWMTLQSNAVFVIHSGWARQVSRVAEFGNPEGAGEMQHSPAYFRALVAELRTRHPDREIRQTRAITLLAQVAADIERGTAPFKAIADLHRDPIHMKHEVGKYLMHNAMRIALGQRISARGFDKVDPQIKQYLDGVLGLIDVAADRPLVNEILSADAGVERSDFLARVADEELRIRLQDSLPEIERAAIVRRRTLALQTEIEAVGGRILFESTGPQWLYLAGSDTATSLFQVPVAINLYDGNNPLKGRGGRNEAVNDMWLGRLAGFTSLRRLDLANCAVRGPGLKHVGTLTGLRELNLTLTPVTDDGLKHLGTLTELRKLGLASTQCNGTGFAHLTALKQLEDVNFHFTPLNDAGLREISRVGVSARLWFAHTHFTDEGAQSLKSLKHLRRCGIGSKSEGSTGNAVAALTQLPLEDLALLDRQASPEGIHHASRIGTLLRLDVSYAPTVTDADLKHLAAMPRLRELKLGHAQITNDGLQSLAACKSLKLLQITRLKEVTDAGVQQLQKSRPDLKVDFQ